MVWSHVSSKGQEMKKEIPTNLERAEEAMVAAGQAQDRLLQKEPSSRGEGQEMKFEDIQSDCPWMVSNYGVNKKNACGVVSTPTHLNTCRKERCGFWAWQAKYGGRQEMTERQFKVGDTVVSPGRVGRVVELFVFKPDGKGPHDFVAGVYGSFACGVVWENRKTATYHFEKNLGRERNNQEGIAK